MLKLELGKVQKLLIAKEILYRSSGAATVVAGVVNKIIVLATGVAGGVGVVLVLFGAYTILTSAGNPNKVKEGQEIIINALIGLVVVMMAVALVRTIGNELNLFEFNV